MGAFPHTADELIRDFQTTCIIAPYLWNSRPLFCGSWIPASSFFTKIRCNSLIMRICFENLCLLNIGNPRFWFISCFAFCSPNFSQNVWAMEKSGTALR
jgi:hypothetical protein